MFDGLCFLLLSFDPGEKAGTRVGARPSKNDVDVLIDFVETRLRQIRIRWPGRKGIENAQSGAESDGRNINL